MMEKLTVIISPAMKAKILKEPPGETDWKRLESMTDEEAERQAILLDMKMRQERMLKKSK